MKLAIIANPEKYSVKDPFIEVLQWADIHEVSVFLSKKLKELYNAEEHSSTVITQTEQEAVDQADITVTIGGDGTILYTARLLRESGKPVIGINSGRLGFLAHTQRERIVDALNCLLHDNYITQKRHLLQATNKEGDTYYALNEFLFFKKDSTSMVAVNASYDDMFINKYWGDGLIVASPTGSTGYNLSSDGPIVMPNSQVMALTPVNSHTLTTRSVILPSNKPLEITVDNQQHDVIFAYDGHNHVIKATPFKIEIKQSDYTLNLIELPEKNYFDTLRHKLMWGKDFRESKN